MTKFSGFTFHHTLDGPSLHLYYAGNLTYASDMFRLFLQHSPAEVKNLQKLLQNEDWEGLAFNLHKLRPSFSMVGLRLLAERAESLKRLIDEEAEAYQLHSQMQELLLELKAKLPVIREELGRMQHMLSN